VPRKRGTPKKHISRDLVGGKPGVRNRTAGIANRKAGRPKKKGFRGAHAARGSKGCLKASNENRPLETGRKERGVQNKSRTVRAAGQREGRRFGDRRRTTGRIGAKPGGKGRNGTPDPKR